jgi:predicted dehydrogenase
LVGRADVDAVLVLGSQWFGSSPVLAACEFGKAIYWAAALDLDPQRALYVKQRVEEAGIAFMAEFPRRYSPATLRLKELIATHLGPPRLIFAHARLVYTARRAHHERCMPVVALNQELVELVDWCRYVADGDPTSLLGVEHASIEGGGKMDYRMMSLDFSDSTAGPGNGVLAHISCGRYMPADWPEASTFRPPAGLQVCCQNGVAFVDLPASLVWFDRAGRHLELLDAERPVGEMMLSQFHRAVTSLVRRTRDLEDAYRAARIVTLAAESFQKKERVPIDFLAETGAR